jgi:phage host-nuclease inhibitor protein Gam
VREITMSETIEMEVVRLIREISDEEQKLKQLEIEAGNADRIEYGRKGYAAKIRNCKESLERKLRLLKTLKA